MNLTLEAQKRAVVSIVGAVNEDVRALIARNIDAIWSAAQQRTCFPSLLFLYAQREAIDFALMYLAPLISTKKGIGDAYRVSEGAARGRGQSRVDGASQGWSCDWANTSSFNVHRSDGDAFTRARSQSNAENNARFESHTWSRGQSRTESNSRSQSERQSNTVRTSESRSRSESFTLGRSRETSGVYLPTPYVDPIHQWQKTIDIGICGDPLFYPDRNGCNSWYGFSVSLGDPVELWRGDFPIGYVNSECPAVPVRCVPISIVRDSESKCNPPSAEDLFSEAWFSGPALCNWLNFAAHIDQSITVYVPTPIGVFSLSGAWTSGIESRPRCYKSRQETRSDSRSVSASFMRAVSTGNARSYTETIGFRRNDAHTRAQGNSRGSSLAVSATQSSNVHFAETHSGSNTNSHGESQSSSRMETQSSTRSTSWQKTESTRLHRFDIFKYSDAFKALHDLRQRIDAQIEHIKRVLKTTMFTKSRVRDVSVKHTYNPAWAHRGFTRSAPACLPVFVRSAHVV